MASAKQRKATFISNKLTFLKDQGDDLISAVGQYVNRITAAGDSWTQGGDNSVEFQELCQMIDTPALFLCEKCQDLADLTSQSVTATASTPATSDRQPAAPLASTATTSSKQSTEIIQHADGAQMKPVLERIAVIEEAMCSFRSRTETVAEQQSGIDQQLKECLSKLSESDKKHSSGFEQVKQQISDISETRDAIEQEQKTRLQSLEKQLQKAEMESQAELMEKLVHVPNLLESVKQNIDALDDRIDGIIDDCRNKHEDIETVTRDLANKVMANTQSVQLISEGQAQNTTMSRELEIRLQTLEADGERNVKDVQKQAEKGEANFRILCQMLNGRLRPLEQLRTCLNERASVRDENVTKLTQLIQEVAVISPRLQQLELKSPGTRCGFTARNSCTGKAASYISQYETTNCNVGENFNADTGIFTAPVDGLYVASISVCLGERESLEVCVGYSRTLDQEYNARVCVSSAVTNQTTACGVGLIDMKADGAHMKPVLDRIAAIEEAIRSFRRRTEKVAEQQSGIDQQLKELLCKLSESDKEHSSRYEQVKQQISDISDAHDEIEQEQKTRLHSLEIQLQKISTAQNRLKAEMESQAESVEKFVHVPDLLKSVKENVDVLVNRVGGIVDNCRNEHEAIEAVTRDLTVKVMANTQSVQHISEGQAQNTTLLRELETRLQTLEADGGRHVKDVVQQVEKVKSHLSQLTQEAAAFSRKLLNLEMKSPGTRCGFRARAYFTGDVVNTTISQYRRTDCNVGDKFNADSGIFTAPVDGLYVAAISLYLWENEHLSVGVEYINSLDGQPVTDACVCSAVTKQTTACNVIVVSMKAGELLYSRVYHMEKNNYLKMVYFSCFLLG